MTVPTTGNVIKASELPGGTIGYAQVTANQGSITTAVDLTGLSVTVSVGSGRRIRLTGVALFASTVAADGFGFLIAEGATTLQQAQTVGVTAAANTAMQVSVILTPSAGSHTYKLQGQRASGSGTVTMNAGATFPAFILCEDVGV